MKQLLGNSSGLDSGVLGCFLKVMCGAREFKLEGKRLLESPGAGSDSYSLLGAMKYLRRQSGSIDHTSGKMTVKNQKGTKTHTP